MIDRHPVSYIKLNALIGLQVDKSEIDGVEIETDTIIVTISRK